MDLDQLRQMMQNGTLGTLTGEPEKASGHGEECPCADCVKHYQTPATSGGGEMIKQIKLHFQGETRNKKTGKVTKSNKVYNIELVKTSDGGFKLTGFGGARGKALKEYAKGTHPTLFDGRAAFDKLQLEKTKKGYKVGAGS